MARPRPWSRASPTRCAAEQRVGEFHLYSLPGKSTLLPGLTTSVALFEPATVPYEKSYVVHGLVPYWGILPQQGDEEEAPVEVTYTLKRPRKTGFGDRPLPGGVARMFEQDSAGRLQLVGEAAMDHTPRARTCGSPPAPRSISRPAGCRPRYVTRRDSTKAAARAPSRPPTTG